MCIEFTEERHGKGVWGKSPGLRAELRQRGIEMRAEELPIAIAGGTLTAADKEEGGKKPPLLSKEHIQQLIASTTPDGPITISGGRLTKEAIDELLKHQEHQLTMDSPITRIQWAKELQRKHKKLASSFGVAHDNTVPESAEK